MNSDLAAHLDISLLRVLSQLRFQIEDARGGDPELLGKGKMALHQVKTG